MIKFDPPSDDHRQYDFEVKTYKAPTTGWYQISEVMCKAVPTGNTILIPNPDRKWFEFWKPKMTTRPEFNTVLTHEGVAMRFLEEGQEINTKYLHRLSGPVTIGVEEQK